MGFPESIVPEKETRSAPSPYQADTNFTVTLYFQVFSSLNLAFYNFSVGSPAVSL